MSYGSESISSAQSLCLRATKYVVFIRNCLEKGKFMIYELHSYSTHDQNINSATSCAFLNVFHVFFFFSSLMKFIYLDDALRIFFTEQSSIRKSKDKMTSQIFAWPIKNSILWSSSSSIVRYFLKVCNSMIPST